MKKDDLIKTVLYVSLNQGLDPALVASVCEHESSFDPFAVRYEPGFYDRYVSAMKGLTATEMTMRATSFGLMQVMGQTARELGFDATFLTELLDPLNACIYGCRKLKRELDREKGDVRAALLRFNGSGNANYPDLVLSHYGDYAYLNSGTMRS